MMHRFFLRHSRDDPSPTRRLSQVSRRFSSLGNPVQKLSLRSRRSASGPLSDRRTRSDRHPQAMVGRERAQPRFLSVLGTADTDVQSKKRAAPEIRDNGFQTVMTCAAALLFANGSSRAADPCYRQRLSDQTVRPHIFFNTRGENGTGTVHISGITDQDHITRRFSRRQNRSLKRRKKARPSQLQRRLFHEKITRPRYPTLCRVPA